MPMLGSIEYRENGFGLVEVTRKSPFAPSGSTHVLPLTLRHFEEGYKKWAAGQLIQIAFPHLDADAREFLMTGIPPGQFEAVMNGDKKPYNIGRI